RRLEVWGLCCTVGPRPEKLPSRTQYPQPAKTNRTSRVPPQDAEEIPTNTKNTKVPFPNRHPSNTSVRPYLICCTRLTRSRAARRAPLSLRGAARAREPRRGAATARRRGASGISPSGAHHRSVGATRRRCQLDDVLSSPQVEEREEQEEPEDQEREEEEEQEQEQEDEREEQERSVLALASPEQWRGSSPRLVHSCASPATPGWRAHWPWACRMDPARIGEVISLRSPIPCPLPPLP
ncbi:unnamed protein product, partial [Prorocentrum cordatum]